MKKLRERGITWADEGANGAAVYQAMESPDKLCALNSALLVRLARKEGVELSPDAVHAMERWAAELVVRNQRDNLTRLTRADEIAVQHLVDSLMVLKGLPGWPASTVEENKTTPQGQSLSLVDIGSGAGLPGIPLAVVRPGWNMTLVESSGKAVNFLRHVVEMLGLENVSVARDRVEALGRDEAHRGLHDVVTARAVARLSVLVEYALPLLSEGGRLVALKGSDAAQEADAAAPALKALGGRLVEVIPYDLPSLERTRNIVVVEKIGPTPEKYPRRIGVARRSPLEVEAK